jgi:hypothetical protein
MRGMSPSISTIRSRKTAGLSLVSAAGGEDDLALRFGQQRQRPAATARRAHEQELLCRLGERGPDALAADDVRYVKSQAFMTSRVAGSWELVAHRNSAARGLVIERTGRAAISAVLMRL